MNAKIQKCLYKTTFYDQTKRSLLVLIKCNFQHIYNVLQYEIYSPLPPSKAAQILQNTAQNYGTKCTTCCTMKFIVFSLCSSFIIQVKNKVYILIWVCRLVVEKFHKPLSTRFQILELQKWVTKLNYAKWRHISNSSLGVTNSKVKLLFDHFRVTNSMVKICFSTFELLTRTWKILNYTSSY